MAPLGGQWYRKYRKWQQDPPRYQMPELDIAPLTAKIIKTEEDLNEFRPMLAKITVDAALNVEPDDHLGFAKHEQSEANNSCNGTTGKTLQTEDSQFELDTPRERAGSFKPRLVKKHQHRFTSMDDKILFLYSQGMDDPRNRHDIQENVRSRCLRHTHI